jgi:hypothetical protein
LPGQSGSSPRTTPSAWRQRGVCALHLKVIAVAAGVSVGTAREAIMIVETIGLVTVEHLRGFYDIRCRSPDWLPALRELRGL